MPALAPNLSTPSGPLRRETLRALCAFRQPPLLSPPGAAAPPPPPGQGGAECDVLSQLLAIESRQMGVDSGRPAGAHVARDLVLGPGIWFLGQG